jgi:hypothetical protein
VSARFHFYSDERPDLETPWLDATDYLLVPHDTPGFAVIRTDKRWTVVYEDGDAVLFARAADRDLIGRCDRGELRTPAIEVAEFFR